MIFKRNRKQTRIPIMHEYYITPRLFASNSLSESLLWWSPKWLSNQTKYATV